MSLEINTWAALVQNKVEKLYLQLLVKMTIRDHLCPHHNDLM